MDVQNQWGTLGMTELLTYLKISELFDTSYHSETLKTMRGERGCIIHYNNKKIYLDLWDYSSPTYSEEVFNANFDLIIKLQHAKVTEESFEDCCQHKNMFLSHSKEARSEFFKKIVPWTFFCSRNMKGWIGKEDQILPLPPERFGFFCGRDWKCRNRIKAKLISENIPYMTSDREVRSLALSDKDFIRWMQTSKFGIVIHGRGSWMAEGKNRREIDYMMLKIPLLINYKPYYYNPLIEGKHYIYIDENTDFKNLENVYNTKDMVNNAYQWYQDNASPKGVAKTFMQIMNDRGF